MIWCLVQLPNNTTLAIECANKPDGPSIGQQCLEKVCFWCFIPILENILFDRFKMSQPNVFLCAFCSSLIKYLSFFDKDFYIPESLLRNVEPFLFVNYLLLSCSSFSISLKLFLLFE